MVLLAFISGMDKSKLLLHGNLNKHTLFFNGRLIFCADRSPRNSIDNKHKAGSRVWTALSFHLRLSCYVRLSGYPLSNRMQILQIEWCLYLGGIVLWLDCYSLTVFEKVQAKGVKVLKFIQNSIAVVGFSMANVRSSAFIHEIISCWSLYSKGGVKTVSVKKIKCIIHIDFKTACVIHLGIFSYAFFSRLLSFFLSPTIQGRKLTEAHQDWMSEEWGIISCKNMDEQNPPQYAKK